MAEEVHGESKSLSIPSREMAEKILRKVSWDERIDGYIYDPGPGPMPEWILRVEELYNLLSGLPDFSVDFRQVQQWVGEVLGDQEVADRIGEALEDRPEEETRPFIADLLGERIAQCRAVLEVAEEVRQGKDLAGPTRA